MTEYRRVEITGGTAWIGLMLFCLVLNSCATTVALQRIEKHLRALTTETCLSERGTE